METVNRATDSTSRGCAKTGNAEHSTPNLEGGQARAVSLTVAESRSERDQATESDGRCEMWPRLKVSRSERDKICRSATDSTRQSPPYGNAGGGELVWAARMRAMALVASAPRA